MKRFLLSLIVIGMVSTTAQAVTVSVIELDQIIWEGDAKMHAKKYKCRYIKQPNDNAIIDRFDAFCEALHESLPAQVWSWFSVIQLPSSTTTFYSAPFFPSCPGGARYRMNGILEQWNYTPPGGSTQVFSPPPQYYTQSLGWCFV